MLDAAAAILPPLFMIAMVVVVGLSAYRATDGAAREDAADDLRRQQQADLETPNDGREPHRGDGTSGL